MQCQVWEVSHELSILRLNAFTTAPNSTSKAIHIILSNITIFGPQSSITQNYVFQVNILIWIFVPKKLGYQLVLITRFQRLIIAVIILWEMWKGREWWLGRGENWHRDSHLTLWTSEPPSVFLIFLCNGWPLPTKETDIHLMEIQYISLYDMKWPEDWQKLICHPNSHPFHGEQKT